MKHDTVVRVDGSVASITRRCVTTVARDHAGIT